MCPLPAPLPAGWGCLGQGVYQLCSQRCVWAQTGAPQHTHSHPTCRQTGHTHHTCPCAFPPTHKHTTHVLCSVHCACHPRVLACPYTHHTHGVTHVHTFPSMSDLHLHPDSGPQGPLPAPAGKFPSLCGPDRKGDWQVWPGPAPWCRSSSWQTWAVSLLLRCASTGPARARRGPGGVW